MINRNLIFHAVGSSPHENLATEKYLVDAFSNETAMLYLWQNKRTVVIGKNQHASAECDFKKLRADGGTLARRHSGGGAVYQDLGNLNFTFIMPKEDYDVARQLSVIVAALKNFGIVAVPTGRNDIETDGKKFSGNAFSTGKNHNIHHGTILLSVDMSALAGYLLVDKTKLQSKGVTSVKSRVINLNTLSSTINVSTLSRSLERAFICEYGGEAELYTLTRKDKKSIAKLYKDYSSDRWNIGRDIKATVSRKSRFPFGGVEVSLIIRGDVITDAQIYSDALNTQFVEQAADALKNTAYDQSHIDSALAPLLGRGFDDEILAVNALTLGGELNG